MERVETQKVDQKGRPLGRRALETRRRLLDATAELLGKRGVREIRVVEIAREVDTSPATFYQYFKDVEEATLALAEEAAQEMPALAEKLAGAWNSGGGLEIARTLVDAFIRHWDAYHAVLRLRNLAADEGEPRFLQVRRQAMTPILDELARCIRESQEAGLVSPQINAHAASAALAAILERLAAYHTELESLGVTRDDLVETSARILHQTVTGSSGKSV
ncbi:MAG: TetR/AcrR family transcriptional regulator [Deltaproteobacteria bacterium]|nr:MAG: TetR/AcrR family transcriptional regulator [Deltaproteobacteria bacterium]